MASHQYTSIIRLFNFCGIDTGEAYNPLRARKQLQAEFGIAQDGFIEAEGFVYTRHDVWEEIERPDFEHRLVFHQQIWESSQLLELLEQNTVNVYTIESDFEPFRGDTAFDDFFSPYFQGPFQYVSRVLLTDHKLQEMAEWLRYEDFLLPAQREEALRPLRVYLDENQRLLRNVNKDNFSIMRPKIAQWMDSSWYLLFNNLPYEFGAIKHDLAILLINLSVALQKKHLQDCRSLSDQLISVTGLEENLRTTILSNHDAYYSSGTHSRFSIAKGSWWIIWILIMVLRAGFICNNSSSNSDSYNFINSAPLAPDTANLLRGIRSSPDTSSGKTPVEPKRKGTVLDSILKRDAEGR